jgi:hypothetical protein
LAELVQTVRFFVLKLSQQQRNDYSSSVFSCCGGMDGPMPRYYFHVRSCDGLSKDEEGAEFPDAESAREEGEAGAREILADILKRNASADSRIMEVTDEDGGVVAKIAYKDILAVAVR